MRHAVLLAALVSAAGQATRPAPLIIDDHAGFE